MLFGLIAAFLYWWTGSLLVPVLAHALANLTTAFYTVAGEQSFTTPVVGVVAVLGPVLAARSAVAAPPRARGPHDTSMTSTITTALTKNYALYANQPVRTTSCSPTLRRRR